MYLEFAISTLLFSPYVPLYIIVELDVKVHDDDIGSKTNSSRYLCPFCLCSLGSFRFQFLPFPSGPKCARTRDYVSFPANGNMIEIILPGHSTKCRKSQRGSKKVIMPFSD